MSSSILALPLPLVGRTRIQASLDAAVHVQSGVVVNVTAPPVESQLMFRVDGATEYEHVVPACTTRATCSFTITVTVRASRPSFCASVSVSDLLPLPLPGATSA